MKVCRIQVHTGTQKTKLTYGILTIVKISVVERKMRESNDEEEPRINGNGSRKEEAKAREREKGVVIVKASFSQILNFLPMRPYLQN